MHWTQKPENREKVIAQLRKATRAKKTKKKTRGPVRLAPDARARLSTAMKESHARRRAAAANGHGSPPPRARVPLAGKKLAKESVRALALEGARHRLLAIEQERELLLIFLKAAP